MINRINYFLLLLLCTVGVKAQSWDADIKENQIKLHARLNHYDTDRYNLLLERKRVELTGDYQSLEFQGSQWQVTRQVKLREKSGKYQIEITFKCLSGEVKDASVSIDFDFNNWSKKNYVLMPAAVYNGNRYPYVKMEYPPFFNNKSQMGLDKPLWMSDCLRLNYQDGYSRIQERSGSMSIPSIGFHAPGSQRGFWLFFNQGNSYGDYGVDIEENRSRDKAIISLTSPVMREVYKYQMCTMQAPSDDQPVSFKAGDEVAISFVVDFFECPSVQTLYDQMVVLRTELYPEQPKPNLITFSETYRLIEQNKNKLNWRNEGYYAAGINNNWGQDWQPGWVGGLITTYALLTDGNTLSKERVVKNLNWLYPKGLSPSGLYYDIRYNGEFLSAKYKMPFGADLALTSKNADAVYYALKQFDLLQKLNIPVKEEWKSGNLRALEAQLAIWNKYGQSGQYANQITGELIIGNTTSAGLFPAALCEAYRQTQNERYLIAAKQIAEYYYSNFVVKGLICGGSSDAMQSFDADTSYELLESFTKLYETTGDAKWLQIAEEMAAQFTSWVVAYDYQFPVNSIMGKMGLQTAGTVYANTQNKHTAPGICTHSGIGLLKLYRATQNRFYLDMLCSIARTIPQYMSFPGHEIPGYREGWISERINMTDWQIFPPIGGVSPGSCWDETSMMLTYAELPGIYVNKSNREVFVLDHVDAKLSKKGQLEITNPTKYDAVVKVLAETKEQMVKPLGQNAFLNWEKVTIEAGKRLLIKL